MARKRRRPSSTRLQNVKKDFAKNIPVHMSSALKMQREVDSANQHPLFCTSDVTDQLFTQIFDCTAEVPRPHHSFPLSQESLETTLRARSCSAQIAHISQQGSEMYYMDVHVQRSSVLPLVTRAVGWQNRVGMPG